MIIAFDFGNEPDKTVLTFRRGAGLMYSRELDHGEKFTWLPDLRGVVIMHPDRAPVWLHMADGRIVLEPYVMQIFEPRTTENYSPGGRRRSDR